MMEISNATFAILEKLSEKHPELKAGFARSTGGVDVDLVVAVLSNDLRAERQYASEIEDSILQSSTLDDLRSVKRTIEAIRQAGA